MKLEILQKLGRAGNIECLVCSAKESYSKEEIKDLYIGLCRACLKKLVDKIRNDKPKLKTWKSLGPDEKELAYQMRAAGLSYREISESLDISYDGARKAMYRKSGL